jgi:hypothetical protein
MYYRPATSLLIKRYVYNLLSDLDSHHDYRLRDPSVASIGGLIII